MVWMNEWNCVKYIKCKIQRNSGGMHLGYFLFEDVICVLMKVVYLIICHWTTSNFDVVQWHNIILISLIPMNQSIGGDLAPSLGGRETISLPHNFADQERFLGKKCPFSRGNFWWPFLVIDHDFRIFLIFHIFAACNVALIWPFLHKTNPYFK